MSAADLRLLAASLRRSLIAGIRVCTVPVLLTLVASLTPSLVLAAPSEAAGGRWPQRTVTYRDRSDYPDAVRQAIAAWNAAGTQLRLRSARRGRRADITVRTESLPEPLGGWAYFPPGGEVRLDDGLSEVGDPILTSTAAEVAVHELGHAVGLPHSRRGCRVMAPVAMLADCDAPEGAVRCGPQRGDVRALARKYGWRRDGRERLADPFFGLCRAPVPEPDGDDPPDDPGTVPPTDPGVPEDDPAADPGTWEDDGMTCTTTTDADGSTTTTCTSESSSECVTDESGTTTCTSEASAATQPSQGIPGAMSERSATRSGPRGGLALRAYGPRPSSAPGVGRALAARRAADS